MDSESQDSDEGVELSPVLGDFIDAYPEDFNYNEECRHTPVVEARTVYVLLPKNVPVSRCSRLQWLLQHLNTTVTVPTILKTNNSCTDLQIISAIPIKPTLCKKNKFLITSRTEIVFLAQSYRFVYCLDMSPSQSVIDFQKGVILFDEIFSCFKISLEGLCQQFTVPGNTLIFQPCIYLTVIVNTPFFMSPAQQVLVKGVQVTTKNLQEIIHLVQVQFNLLENRIAQVSALAHDQMDSQRMQSEGIVGGLFDLPEKEQFTNGVPMVSPDANFVNMLRYSMLAISLLPENSLSNILVITDGVLAMPDSTIMESLLFQLHYDSIAVSFLKIGSPFNPHCSAGYVAYMDLLYFLSQCTLGSCMENITNISSEPTMEINIYHELYLLWSFYTRTRYSCTHLHYSEIKWGATSSSFLNNKSPVLLSKRQTEENVNASIFLLIARRMREGYTVDAVNYVNGFIEVKLSLQWKSFIYIQYNITSEWPITRNVAHFEVQISAPYEFLYDITCLMKKESKSTLRQAVIERFWIRLTQLASNDCGLAQQLTSFQNSNVWYTLPESVRSGIPVFILNTNIIHDACKLALTPRDVSCPKFVYIWQPVCQLDTNSWRKWFHTHKMSLILKHDHPLPKHLHLANSSGRFQVVQCRQAATVLYGLLSKWASFILIDNNTYLKLLHSEQDKPPQWFCIIRVSSKLPCAIINIGFVTGTPGHMRRTILDDLKLQLSLLSYHSSPPKSKENICCTLLQKPLEKFLIRYERMPSDFTTVIFPDGTQPPLTLQSLPSSPFTGTLFTTLSRYLYHKRWIWSATHSSNLRLDCTALSRILSTLTRMRIQEGFNFAHSSSGIITMVLELNMDTSFSCVVQYVLFPPHSAHWGEGEFYSSSEDDVEPESDMESELQMVTEVWIEPQYGFIRTNGSRIGYLNGKPYYELADMIKQIDASCINSLLTLEHISLMCQEKTVQRLPMNRNGNIPTRKHSENSMCDYFSTPETSSLLKANTTQRIQHTPFKFDPISILSLCQQTEQLFSMFIEAKERYFYPNQKTVNKANEILMDNIQQHMRCIHDYELPISPEQSEQFTLHVIKRHRNKSPNFCPVSENFNKNSAESNHPQWRCFIKGISITHVILTFIPASLQDLKHLVNFDCCNYPNFNFNDTESERTSSCGSSCSDVPINAGNTLTFPVYVYDCPLSLLVDAFVNGGESANVQNKDIYEDHRYKSEHQLTQEEQPVIKLTGDGEQNTSPEPKSEDSDNDNRNSAKQHCRAIILLHSKCFTMSLFSALHSETYIHASDVQAAMDQCEERVYEIDITEYILTVCGHLKQHRRNSITIEELQMTTPCIELRPLHRLIEERFSATLRKAFNPIPTNTEYYYCRNLITAKSEEKHDSDDEISNHPSETVEFQYSDGFQNETHEVNPLFLHLICTVHYNDEVVNTPVKVLPTCLGEIISTLRDSNCRFHKNKLRITLDILCLTLPVDVHNVMNDFSPKGLRATSFSSDYPHSSTSPISEKSYVSDIKGSEPTSYMPDLQKEAIISLKDEIQWLLVDEIITSLLDINPVDINRLNYVMRHVTDNAFTRSSCIKNVIDLNFVYGGNKSFSKFIEEFSKLKLPPYTLCKENDVYYLAKEIFERKENEVFVKNKGLFYGLDNMEDVEVMHQSTEASSQISDASSLNGSPFGTDGGYEEDVSDDDEEDYEWLLHMDNKRPHLPNFWLIMQIEQNAVTIYFHCRFLELPTTLVSRYLAVQRLVSDAVRELCKRVNQSLLLQSLYETRHCHHLLEADVSYTGTQAIIRNSSFSRLKSMEEANDEYENYPPDLAEANLKFKPGYFSCPVVWETPFVLHPRLKTGPGKSGISRGILALKNILDKFSVANRDNMFVYQDKNSNVFYLRLHEDIQGNSCRSIISKSNEYEHSIVSRSPSIASLPLGQHKSSSTQSEITSIIGSEIRPRVRSFGEKETNETPNEDTLILRVHGVTEAGEDVKCELVQVLQNRLDDAVLEFLSVMLARNAMCPLTPEDVHFLQKPFRSAEIMIRISMQEFALKFLDSYIHYLRQNLLQFLNIPKYTDSRSHFHFKDYSETDQFSNKMKEDNIFIYNQSQNPSSGSIGIACIALAIICRSDEPTSDLDDKCRQLFENNDYEKMVSAEIIDTSEVLPDSYLEFRLWKQGRVNMDNLSQKLRNATSQAVWDIVMEHYLLQSPLCCEETTKSSSIQLKDHNIASPLSDEDTFREFENTELLDLSLSSKNIEIEINTGFQIETRSDSISSRRRKRLNPLLQRSTTIDETKDNTNKKSVILLTPFEQGDKGILCDVYSTTLQDWLEFGYTLATPAVKRQQVTLTNRHLTNISVKELQSIITHLSRETAKAFRAIPVNHQEKGCDLYVSYVPTNSIQKCLIISRNFEQWKACVAFKGSIDFPELYNPNNIKHTQKFTPSVTAAGVFIPRQKILWALVETDKIVVYTYNWSKDNVDKLLDYTANLGMWLSVRASFLNSVTAQKIGLFHNQPMTRKEFLPLNNPYIGLIGEGDQMLKFPKDRLRRIGATNATNPPISTLEAFRDCFKNIRYGSLDPVFISTIEMHEIKHSDKKYRESLKKLHAMYQTRTNATTMQQIQILMQNSRIIHYCHTPLLFLPSWRIKSAATRDYSLVQLEGIVYENAKWHKELCITFISEYKRYLQTLGFTPLIIDNFTRKGGKSDSVEQDSVMYIRKAILGGILLFTVKLEEPFVTTKLYIVECNRLQSAALKASVNRFTLTFLDECDRVKILMHLHSFAYDFHLRAIYNYLSNQIENKIYQRYHLTHFLDDFMKYYNKAPNFARNLIYADTLTIRNLMTEGKQLFDYLLTNVAQYNFEVFDMQRDDIKDSEYALVQVTNTHQVSYKDSQDRQHVDDFDMTIIVCNLCSPFVPRDNVLHLKYYLILISRRDIYPKSEIERTLGKFQTVTHVGPSMPINKQDKKPPDSVSKINSSDTECETSNSTDVPSLSPAFDENKRLEEWTNSSFNCTTIKQESINYLGYYSSHEQVMRQLILDCAAMTQKQIKSMVAKGMVHCRTHLLWNKLVSSQESSTLTYAEFMELKGLAKLESLSDMHPNLGSLLNQPLSWYQGLAKLLLVKYADHNRVYMSTDGNIIHYVILHQRYVGAFMLLSIDSHTSRGDLYAVYREPQKYEESEMCIADRKILLDGFINFVCFYLWSNMI